LKPGITKGGSFVYGVIIRPFSPPGNGIPRGGSSPRLPAPPAGLSSTTPVKKLIRENTKIQKEENKSTQEIKQREPASDKKELDQEIPSTQTVVRKISLEGQKQPPHRQEEEETVKNLIPSPIAEGAILIADSSLKEEGKSISSAIGAGGGSGNKSGIGGGLGGEGPGNGGANMPYLAYSRNPKPLYPLEARKKGYEGDVLLGVEVLPNGEVGQIEVKKSSGYEVLDQSALSAVKKWKFIPVKKGDAATPFWVNVPIKFQLLL
jgi:TonB family protein